MSDNRKSKGSKVDPIPCKEKAPRERRLDEAVQWLLLWDTDKERWTFNKGKQNALTSAWMDSQRLSKSEFACFCRFAAGSESLGYRQRLLAACDGVLDRYHENKTDEVLKRQAKRAHRLRAALIPTLPNASKV
ncbi:hypothetical protein GMRT_10474 [Giardia muris]|uniref:WKF domain-containing protein n=1 Tax=Giardia muris TaxID=5742 RepID=A0A4Z1SNV7_GIAMU|nr:hypothetical protein GMRT_10474 [Giardia muris]|eukprot:TNJ26535.1 hypothetical protein GMRT_10474 [Giardia muris]